MLHELIAGNREEIIMRCKAKVATRWSPVPTEEAIDHGVPLFLDELMGALRLGVRSNPETGQTAIDHGHSLQRQGFTVSQVVHDYGDICQAITELAVEVNAPISTEDFGTLSRCLDNAIAGAVTEYERARDQSALDREHADESTATDGDRVLEALRARRLSEGVCNPEQFLVSEFIAELAPAAAVEANAHGIRLAVMPVEDGVVIEADRPILAAVVGNLLRNAFKFTRPGTTVTLTATASAERVLIEIEDECGGFLSGDVNQLLRPLDDLSVDRTRLGLGLAFSRWGVEANHGRIYTRSLPERGCIFTVDLPRLAVSTSAAAD